MSNAARIRIGRVKMKAGGAEVRVLPVGPQNDCMIEARRWIGLVAEEGAPDAFVALAFYYDEKTPGQPTSILCWHTAHPAFPVRILGDMAMGWAQARINDQI